jgi:hypothetical protein
MHRLLKQPGCRPPRTRPGLRGPDHRRDQRGRHVRHRPRGLAPGPARRAPGALHPAALGQVPRAARPGAPGASRRGSSRTARCRAKLRATPPATRWPAEASARSNSPPETLGRRGLVPGGDSFAGALASAVCDGRGCRSAWRDRDRILDSRDIDSKRLSWLDV